MCREPGRKGGLATKEKQAGIFSPAYKKKAAAPKKAVSPKKKPFKFRLGQKVVVKIGAGKELRYDGIVKKRIEQGSARQNYYTVTGFGDPVEEKMISAPKRPSVKAKPKKAAPAKKKAPVKKKVATKKATVKRKATAKKKAPAKKKATRQTSLF